MAEVREQALAFLNEAKMQEEASVKADFLNRMMELVLHQDPSSLLPEFVPCLLEFQADPGSPVRENVAKMIEGIGLHQIDYVQVVAPALLVLLQDAAPAVVQRAITSGSTIFQTVFEQVALQGMDRGLVDQDILECWNWMIRFKEAVYSLAFQPGNDNVRLLALKFVETTLLLFTPNSNSSSLDQQTFDGTSEGLHMTRTAGEHSVLDANMLQQEALMNLGLLLTQLQTPETPSLSCLIAFAVINSLTGIAERRPFMSPKIIPVLLSLAPSCDPVMESHTENVIHELKSVSLNILTSDQPSALPWREHLIPVLMHKNVEETGDQIIKEPGSPAPISGASEIKVTGPSVPPRTGLKPRSTSATATTVTGIPRIASPLRQIRTSPAAITVTPPPLNASAARQTRTSSAGVSGTAPPRTASPSRQTRTPSATTSMTAPPRTASPLRQTRTASAATSEKGPPRTASPLRQTRTSSVSSTVPVPPRTASPSSQPKTSSTAPTVTAVVRPASPLRQAAKTSGPIPQNGLSSGKGLRGSSPARTKSGAGDKAVCRVPSSPRAGISVENPKSSSVIVPFPTSVRSSSKPALTSLKGSPRPSPSSSPRAVPSVENARSSGVIVPFPLTASKSLPKPSVKFSPRPASPSVKPAPRSASPSMKSSARPTVPSLNSTALSLNSTARPASPSMKSTPRSASPSARATIGTSPRIASVHVASRPASPFAAGRKGMAASPIQPPSPSPCASENKSMQVPMPNGPPTGLLASSRAGSYNGKPSASTNPVLASSNPATTGRIKLSPSATSQSLLKSKVGSLIPLTRKGAQLPSCESPQNLSSSRSDPNLEVPPDSVDATATKSVVLEVPTQRLRIASFKRNSSGLSKTTEIVSPEILPAHPMTLNTKKRCGWITSQSDDAHIAYHDNEWGIPVYDDKLLFELIVLQGAQAELSWPTILARRNNFRAVFANFDPATVAKFDEKKKLSLIADSSICFPEAKVRGAVDNAAHVLKIIEEYGSLSKFLWSYVNHKPIVSQYKLAKQVPVKTPKSEALSKELLRRGFRFVGPTTMYSVMQAAGLVCDHLVTCYKYQESSAENSPVTDLVTEGEKVADPWQRISMPVDMFPLEFRRASANACDPVWADLPIIEEAREEELEKNSEDGEAYDDISMSSKCEIPVC